MKMNYHHRNDRKFRKIWLIFLLIIAVTIIFLFSSSIRHFLGATLHFAGYPIWKSKVYISDKTFYLRALLNSRAKLADDKRLLEEELQITNLRLAENALIEEENRSLKALLGREDVSETLPALVLARPPQTVYDVFIIDIGKNMGLQGGETVFLESVILGTVEEVYGKTSRVRLFSSGDIETHAFVQRTNLPVLVRGRGGGNFEAKLPQEVQIEEGDFLVILDTPNRLLGQVDAIDSSPTGSFKRILFRYPVNLSEIRWVAVEKN